MLVASHGSITYVESDEPMTPWLISALLFLGLIAINVTFVLSARTGRLQWRFGDGDYSPLVVAGKRALLVAIFYGPRRRASAPLAG